MPNKKEILNELFRTRTLTLVLALIVWIILMSLPWYKYLKQPTKNSKENENKKSSSLDTLNRTWRLSLHHLLTYEIPIWPHMTALQILTLAVYFIILIPLCVIELNWESTREYKLYGYLASGLMCVGSILPLRKSILDWIFGISFNQIIFLHRWIGNSVVILSWIHGGLYLISWIKRNIVWEEVTEDGNWQGVIAGIIMIFMALLSLPIVRRRFFTLFKWFHILSVPTLIGLLIVHAPKTKNYMYALIAFYGLDILMRCLSYINPVTVNGTKHREGLVKLYLNQTRSWFSWFSLSRSPKPGQFYFVYAPKASMLLSHPFSIVSSAEDCSNPSRNGSIRHRGGQNTHDLEAGLNQHQHATENSSSSDTSTLHNAHLQDANLTFTVRSLGPFSSRLAQVLHSPGASVDAASSLIRLEGPYGKSFDGIWNSSVIVLAGGGIGAAPLFSILKSIVHSCQGSKKLPHVEFIWAVRRCAQIKWFKEEMQQLMTIPSIRIRIHVTGEDESIPSPSEGFSSIATPVPVILNHPISEKKNGSIPTSPSSSASSSHGSSHNTTTTSPSPNNPEDTIEEVLVNPYCLSKGRPCFISILREVKRAFPDENVAVATCGPKSLVRDVRRGCINVSDGNGLFSLYTEEFEY